MEIQEQKIECLCSGRTYWKQVKEVFGFLGLFSPFVMIPTGLMCKLLPFILLGAACYWVYKCAAQS